MAKLIELKEAADLLGITPDDLTELRSHNKIFGYRDGSTWKFKETELERYAAQEGITLGAGPPPDVEEADLEASEADPESKAAGKSVDADLDELVDLDEDDSILVSEESLGSSEPGASSTIIGKDDLKAERSSESSDLKLASTDSEINLDEDSMGGSELDLDESDGSELQLSDASNPDVLDDASDLKLEGSATGVSGLSLDSDSSIDFDMGSSGPDLHSKNAESDSASATGELTGVGSGEDIILDDSVSDGALELGDDELLLESESVSNISLDGSEIDLDLASGTDANLLSDGSGSDVTLNAGDSGINLTSPSESGISLETTPGELGGSDVEALELGEAEIVDLDDEDIDIDAATQLKADDDFLLSPVEGALGEETESGSQVIALDAEEFEEAGDTMLADSVAAPVMEVDEEFGSLPAGAAAPVGAVAAVPGGAAAPAELPEAPYSIWNVLGLAGCAGGLMLIGIMMVDLLRSMWSWREPFSLNSWLMDTILAIFGS